MELNNSNAASAFFTFLLFLPLKKDYRIFHFSFFTFPLKRLCLNGVSLFYLFTFLLFYL